jgi:hypothetical protein
MAGEPSDFNKVKARPSALSPRLCTITLTGVALCDQTPVGVAPAGLVGVVAGASIDSMGLLSSQQGAVQRSVSLSRIHLPVTPF